MGIFKSIGRGLGKVAKPLVNFPRWMDLRSVSTTAKDIGKMAKGLFVPQQATRQETFEEAVKRLHLTEENIQERMKTLLRLTLVYCLIAVALGTYTGYLLVNGRILAALLSFTLTFLSLAFAFREHFWYYQMKQRRLGCGIKEWFIAIFGGAQK
ncbi:MAG: type IVB secretion system protein IcmV [Gammaproteobacteria bacterium]